MTSVRTRFAPAPSGSVHVGNARTALFSWAYARHHGGRFVLRVEDTDASRATSEAMHALIDVMRWLGVEWDEGPDVGGPHAPYRQSERFDMYRDAVDRLIKDGRVYRCYCTPAELEERRKAAMAAGQTPGYDRRCRTLGADERAAFEVEGRTFAIRFAVPLDGETTFVDRIRGEVRFDNAQIADFIIMRSDGSPTYLLAAAVDDLAMQITHVVRGEDLLSATPRQLMLYEALGATTWPEFAHQPLIVGADRQPLSKRHGHTSVEHYRAEGFLPEALRNYLALLGWSYGDGTTERFTTQEFVEHFTLEAVSRNPAMFDVPKLTAINGEYIRALDVAELAYRMLPFFPSPDRIDVERLIQLTPLVQTRMDVLTQGPPQLLFFFAEPSMDPDAVARYLTAEQATALEQYRDALTALPAWDVTSIEAAMRGVQESLGLTSGKARKTAFHPVRVAVSGAVVGPPLFEALELLGRETTLSRIESGLALARGA
jgi:glutamyl-tRNA synthetase